MNKSTAHTPTVRYVVPGRFVRHVLNPPIAWLTRHGLSVLGTRELRVVGRRSGQVRSTVVNLLEVDGQRYLVSPRGNSHWARNLRDAETCELGVGRNSDVFSARELADDEKPPVLQVFLRRWGWQVGSFFHGLNRHATVDELAAVAGDFPVFALERAALAQTADDRISSQMCR